VTGYGFESQYDHGFSLIPIVHTASGPQLASYPIRAGGFSPEGGGEVKRQGREADHSTRTSAEVKENVDLYIRSPMCLHGIVLS
jgi:hypothetical protein